MKLLDTIQSRTDRAVEALKAVLHQTSAIKLKNVDIDSSALFDSVDLLAEIDVYGHSHTLACRVMESDEQEPTREDMLLLRKGAARVAENATAVLIAPRISEQVQGLCRGNNAGYLDLEGNARLELGEFFMARQCMPQRKRPRNDKPAVRTSARRLYRKLTPKQVEIVRDEGSADTRVA